MTSRINHVPATASDSLHDLMASVLRFRDSRDWKQFHTPRQLAAAIAIEAAELQETMLWKTDAEVANALLKPEMREQIAHEVADVLIYALLMADAVGVDAAESIRAKIALNGVKYPVDKARGNPTKYTDL